MPTDGLISAKALDDAEAKLFEYVTQGLIPKLRSDGYSLLANRLNESISTPRKIGFLKKVYSTLKYEQLKNFLNNLNNLNRIDKNIVLQYVQRDLAGLPDIPEKVRISGNDLSYYSPEQRKTASLYAIINWLNVKMG